MNVSAFFISPVQGSKNGTFVFPGQPFITYHSFGAEKMHVSHPPHVLDMTQ